MKRNSATRARGASGRGGKQSRAPKPVTIELGRRTTDGAIRYALSDQKIVAMVVLGLMLAVPALQIFDAVMGAPKSAPSLPWWAGLTLSPFLLLGLYRCGLDVYQDAGSMVLWRSFGIRIWSRSLPLMVPEVIRREVDFDPDYPGKTRRLSTLVFKDYAMKDVKIKDLGRFMREIQWLVGEREKPS